MYPYRIRDISHMRYNGDAIYRICDICLLKNLGSGLWAKFTVQKTTEFYCSRAQRTVQLAK